MFYHERQLDNIRLFSDFLETFLSGTAHIQWKQLESGDTRKEANVFERWKVEKVDFHRGKRHVDALTSTSTSCRLLVTRRRLMFYLQRSTSYDIYSFIYISSAKIEKSRFLPQGIDFFSIEICHRLFVDFFKLKIHFSSTFCRLFLDFSIMKKLQKRSRKS